MKKYVTKLFSLLMALCMAGALLGMPALAAGDSAGDVPLVDEEGWTVVKVTPTVAKMRVLS